MAGVTRYLSPALVQLALLVGVLALACFLRFWQLDTVPAAISNDEAFDVLDARSILQGDRPIFFPTNNGREVLFMYLQAGVYALGGQGLVQARLVSALAGVLAVGLVYLLGRRMLGPWPALFAAALMATSFWPVFESRLVLRGALLPPVSLVAVLCLWLWWEAVRRGHPHRAWLWAGCAGLAFGAGLYVDTAARLLPLVPLGFIGYLLVTRRVDRRSGVAGLAILAGLLALTFAPQAGYFWTAPDGLTSRTDQISTLRLLWEEGRPGPFIEGIANTAGMFSVRGDPSVRYNLPLRPVFDPVTAVVFYAGLLLCLIVLGAGVSRGRHLPILRRPAADRLAPAAALLTVWLIAGLLPSALALEGPGFLRGIGAQPAVFLLPAVGAVGLHRLIAGRAPGSWNRLVVPAGLAGLVALTAASTTFDYFVTWNRHAEARPARGDAILTCRCRPARWIGPRRKPRHRRTLHPTGERLAEGIAAATQAVRRDGNRATQR